jgi:DNA-binding NtrC family response regulator
MAWILIIEDDEQMREMLEAVIKNVGHDVVSVSDGKYAMGAFINGQYDVVITDIVMPGKDGLKTIQDFRSRFPKIKIIAISGGDRSFSGDTYLDIAHNFGAHRILAKPFSQKTILETIEELISEK